MKDDEKLSLEQFTGRGRSYTPIVSLRKSGQIGFNLGMIQFYDLQNYDGFAVLYFDAHQQVIGVKLVKKAEEGAYRFSIKRGNATISAKSFFNYYKIPVNEAHRYAPTWSDEYKMFLIDLKTQQS